MLLELNRRNVQQLLRDEKGMRGELFHKQQMNSPEE
ncbi:hypothetical protein protein [Bacillus cereus G9241]|nr:hypothetical protein protein [Bacillus cereus G9241]